MIQRHDILNFQDGQSITAKEDLLAYWLSRALRSIVTRCRYPRVILELAKYSCRWVAGVRRCEMIVDGQIWPYLKGGNGPPLILLHGFGADKDRFGTLLPSLTSEYTVIVPDIPGFGENLIDFSKTYDIPGQVGRFKRFVDRLGFSQGFHLGGLSMGGYIAAYYAGVYQNDVSSLFLMSPVGVASRIQSDAWRLFCRTGRNIFLYDTPDQVAELISYLFYHPIDIPVAFKEYFARLGAEKYTERQKLLSDILKGGYTLLEGRLTRIEAPTLVVWGEHDRVAHVSGIEQFIHDIQDIQAIALKRCGHIPFLERPIQTKNAFLSFLNPMPR